MKMLTNWINKVVKIISDGNKTHSFFFWRKGGRMMWEKNNLVTPRLAVPFALKLL